jgi:hypothetical protein
MEYPEKSIMKRFSSSLRRRERDAGGPKESRPPPISVRAQPMLFPFYPSFGNPLHDNPISISPDSFPAHRLIRALEGTSCPGNEAGFLVHLNGYFFRRIAGDDLGMILDSPLGLDKFHLHGVFWTGWKIGRDGFIKIFFCPGATRSFLSGLRPPGRFRTAKQGHQGKAKKKA